MSMPVINSSDTTRCQSITDLIESVALQETALSHILNAEGEKLQKVIAMDNVCTETLLCVNKSVESMVKAVTKLEMVLQSKIENFDDTDCKSTTINQSSFLNWVNSGGENSAMYLSFNAAKAIDYYFEVYDAYVQDRLIYSDTILAADVKVNMETRSAPFNQEFIYPTNPDLTVKPDILPKMNFFLYGIINGKKVLLFKGNDQALLAGDPIYVNPNYTV